MRDFIRGRIFIWPRLFRLGEVTGNNGNQQPSSAWVVAVFTQVVAAQTRRRSLRPASGIRADQRSGSARWRAFGQAVHSQRGIAAL